MTRPFFVTTDWLAEHLTAPDVIVLDGSWYLEITQRDGQAEYLEDHLPGALYFDIDDVADTRTDLPHMLPRPEVFASKMRRLGVGDGQRIIIYDGSGVVSAPRVWWMFRAMGVTDVAILEGGLPAWEDEDRPLDSGPVVRPERHFTARFDASYVCDIDDVRQALKTGSAQLVDTRSAKRFRGEECEPRPNVGCGHIPGSINLPAENLLTPGFELRSDDEIRAAIADAGIDLSRPIITTCGSGVTAAILNFALTVIGQHNHTLYDGSFAEWGRDGSGNPVDKGA